MNLDLWCAFVNLIATGLSAGDSKAIIKNMVCGTAGDKTAAETLMTNESAAMVTQAKLGPFSRAAWYNPDSQLQTLQTAAP